MSKHKNISFTLWRKWRNLGWRPHFTVEVMQNGATDSSPTGIIEDWMAVRFPGGRNSYWKRGKTWMIKPKGQEPAELNRLAKRRKHD